jgi:hypothetical protein
VHFENLKLPLQQVCEVHSLSKDGNEFFLSLSFLDALVINGIILTLRNVLLVPGVRQHLPHAYLFCLVIFLLQIIEFALELLQFQLSFEPI